MADPDFNLPGPIHLILGADVYGEIISPGLIKDDPALPIAQNKIFGWVLSEPVSVREKATTTYGFTCSVDQELQDCLLRFWNQEEVPDTKDRILNEEEKECEQHYATTHSRDNSGRYIVRLSVRANLMDLGDSKAAAFCCLERLSKRLASDPLYKQRYDDFLQEYSQLGHMIPVVSSSKPQYPIYYLPHHGVLREQSATTKLRVVFNASTCSSSGLSLNDVLLTGPKLQTDVADVLLWIRTHRIIFSTDIVKMFRQISVHPADRDLQRILWFDSSKRTVSYQLTTMTYGLNCAPFLALRTLDQLILDEGQRFPAAIIPLTKGRYVDDIIGGSDSVEEAKEIKRQLTLLCAAGSFPLQKWKSNCSELAPPVSNEEEPTSAVEFDSSLNKILGLTWRSEADSFHFSINLPSVTKFTKRSILSDIARCFDPLGLISPVLI